MGICVYSNRDIHRDTVNGYVFHAIDEAHYMTCEEEDIIKVGNVCIYEQLRLDMQDIYDLVDDIENEFGITLQTNTGLASETWCEKAANRELTLTYMVDYVYAVLQQ